MKYIEVCWDFQWMGVLKMNISTKGRYGLRAMLDMAMNASGEPIPLSEVAQRQGISEGYLEQMMAL